LGIIINKVKQRLMSFESPEGEIFEALRREFLLEN